MHPTATALLILTGLWSSTALALEPQVLDGKIVRVHDGDSVTLLDAQNRQHKIRLDGIDAPELGQAFCKTSRHELPRPLTAAGGACLSNRSTCLVDVGASIHRFIDAGQR